MTTSQFVLFGVIAFCILYILNAIKNYISKPQVEEKIKNRYPATFYIEGENEKLQDYENLPSEDEIEKYYKMYLKKFELDTLDIWTTQKPSTYKEYIKRAKTLSEPIKIGNITMMRPGGYQFLIASTSDATYYQPNGVMFVRYRDYEALVKEDENNGRNFFTEEEDELMEKKVNKIRQEMEDEMMEDQVKDQIKEIFDKNA